MPTSSWHFEQLKLFPGPLDNMLGTPAGPVGQYLGRIGRRIERAAKRQVGVRTGALRSSIHFRHQREPKGQSIKLGSELRHAYLHHEGTKPHWITPNKASVLVFRSGTQTVHARAVWHTGTRPNRYLSDNLILVRL